MARITGIGGVFFKSRNDNAALAAWYQKHLGIPLESWGGAVLRWPDDPAEDKGLTVWHVAEKESQWFSPSGSSFMINYRVDNLDEMIGQLGAGGVEIIQGPDWTLAIIRQKNGEAKTTCVKIKVTKPSQHRRQNANPISRYYTPVINV